MKMLTKYAKKEKNIRHLIYSRHFEEMFKERKLVGTNTTQNIRSQTKIISIWR